MKNLLALSILFMSSVAMARHHDDYYDYDYHRYYHTDISDIITGATSMLGGGYYLMNRQNDRSDYRNNRSMDSNDHPYGYYYHRGERP